MQQICNIYDYMCIFSVYMIDSGSPTKTTKFNPSIKKKLSGRRFIHVLSRTGIQIIGEGSKGSNWLYPVRRSPFVVEVRNMRGKDYKGL